MSTEKKLLDFRKDPFRFQEALYLVSRFLAKVAAVDRLVSSKIPINKSCKSAIEDRGFVRDVCHLSSTGYSFKYTGCVKDQRTLNR